MIDTHHPLFGCTFSLVMIVGEDETKRSCVVRLPSGAERFIPLEVTDHAPDPIEIYPHPLSLTAVTRLLEVYGRIKDRSGEAAELPYISESSGEPEEVAAEAQESGEREDKWRLAVASLAEPVEGDTLPPNGPPLEVPEVDKTEERVQSSSGTLPQRSESRLQSEKSSADRLIRLGDVSRYLGVSHGLVKYFAETNLIKTRTNPLDRRMKLVSTRELDEFKHWLREMEEERDAAKTDW